jgi:glycine oxidase
MDADPHVSHSADIIVIGGGLIGSSIALRLGQSGLRVLVLDRGEPGAETSAAAAGMLAPQGEAIEPDAFYELCAASRDLYPDFVPEIEEQSGQQVGYRRDGTLLVAIGDEECHELETLHRAQTRLGLPLERLTPEEVHRRVEGLSPQIRSGLFVPGDHWVDNERLTQAVVETARRQGVTFYSQQPVTKLNVRRGRVECVETSPAGRAAATFSAGQFILAAGCWSRQLVAPLGIHLPMEPCHGQMIEFETSTELPLVVRAGMHYLVPRSPRRILVGTTAEYVGYEKAVTGEGLWSILEGALRIAPLVKKLRLRRAWSGLRPDTADHLPILGYGEMPNLVFATGHFRNGILLAPVTARLIAELVLTGSTSLALDAYRPARFTG